MYVHAYQSYIWNLITSERIKLSSTKPLVGDMVIVKSETSNEGGRPALETSSSATMKHLTEEDLDKYTIFDVVHPLPGFDVEYPKNKIGELYKEMLKADGLDLDRMRRDQRLVYPFLLFPCLLSFFSHSLCPIIYQVYWTKADLNQVNIPSQDPIVQSYSNPPASLGQ